MKKEFNPQKYRNTFNKKNYKQFNVRLPHEEYEKVTNFCKTKNISYRQFILLSYDYLRKINDQKKKK